MTAELLVFLVLAGLAVAGAVNLILQRHPIHSALSLIVVMAALAGLYLLLEAEFVAAVQMIVYAGAIMVLFVFVIMLLNAGARRAHAVQPHGALRRRAAGRRAAAGADLSRGARFRGHDGGAAGRRRRRAAWRCCCSGISRFRSS